MPSIIEDETLRLAFAVQQQPGVYALLLGSGLSSAAHIPTGWGITIDLVRRVGTLRGETAERSDAEWESWYRVQTGRSPDYSDLLAELGLRPAERQPIIASYIEPSVEDRAEGRKLPTQAHHAIARLVAGGYIRVIVTTNFDRLLENALHDAGVEPVVIASPDQVYGAKPLQHVSPGNCTVIKLHGDYLDVRSLNTAEELAIYDAGMEKLLARVFDEYGLIICGWSGIWDTALRNAMLRAPGRRYSTWWADRHFLAGRAEDLARHRDARVLIIEGANELFCELVDQVEAIAQSRRVAPDTIQTLLARAKRYLDDPIKYRIMLNEMVESEADRIVRAMASDEFDGGDCYDLARFRHHIARYESLCTPLMALLGAIGRWGRETAGEADALETILRLAQPTDRQQAYPFNSIRTYPAVLAFTAYGLGLTRAERWKPAWALYDAKLKRKHLDAIRLVEFLFLSTWAPERETERPLFNALEGLENNITPLATRLRAVFEEVGPLFLGASKDLGEVMDRFEFNGALANCHQHSKAQLQQMQAAKWRNQIALPLGLGGWDGGKREAYVAEAIRQASDGSGFAPTGPTWVTLFGEAYEESARFWRLKTYR